MTDDFLRCDLYKTHVVLEGNPRGHDFDFTLHPLIQQRRDEVEKPHWFELNLLLDSHLDTR